MRITFLGAVGTVTGSKYLLETDHHRILVDCGLFQGFKQLRLRNWAPLPVDVRSIDAVVLTHAHIDHSGYLPLLVKHGFKGRVFCTSATRDLCGILLPDAGHLEERAAEDANRHAYSKHHPALPLFTEEDAQRSLSRLVPLDFNRPHDFGKGLSLSYRYAGHILGAAMAQFTFDDETILFSGDLGRPNDPIMRDPDIIAQTDYLVVESTYGNRKHPATSAQDELAEIITSTARRGGSVVVPAFAVGRAQLLLYHLYRLKMDKRIPDLPIFLDSPMAIDASDIFRAHVKDHRLSPLEAKAVCAIARQTPTGEESKAIDHSQVPSVIVSASGMATGGRVLHHLKVFAPDHRNTILFTGFQAGGTRGAAMVAGAQTIKIFGEYIPVRAEVKTLDMLSAHADADEILSWLGHFEKPPKTTFVTHGEPDAADALRKRIEETLKWHAVVPAYRDEFELTP
ncbi:MAG: MBL fold metallo-hydrolase RNA specificity domain-containing protein [Xanthobacteraceae bacterium]